MPERGWRNIPPMAQFDPLKKPMSLEESERLLKGADEQEHAKDSWYTMGMADQ